MEILDELAKRFSKREENLQFGLLTLEERLDQYYDAKLFKIEQLANTSEEYMSVVNDIKILNSYINKIHEGISEIKGYIETNEKNLRDFNDIVRQAAVWGMDEQLLQRLLKNIDSH